MGSTTFMRSDPKSVHTQLSELNPFKYEPNSNTLKDDLYCAPVSPEEYTFPQFGRAARWLDIVEIIFILESRNYRV